MVWDLRLCRSLGRFWRRVGYHLNKIVPLHYLLVYTTICGQSSSCLLKFHFNNFELDKEKVGEYLLLFYAVQSDLDLPHQNQMYSLH